MKASQKKRRREESRDTPAFDATIIFKLPLSHKEAAKRHASEIGVNTSAVARWIFEKGLKEMGLA